MSIVRACWLALVALVLVGLGPSRSSEAAPARQTELPAELSEWVEWVKDVEPEPRDCRQLDDGVTICVWPGALSLDVKAEGATFALDVSVFGPAEVELPGDERQWPQDVEVDGKIRPVLREGEAPTVELDEGSHVVTGFIPWREAPDSLRIPASVGLVDLVVGGKAVPFPLRTGVTLSLEDFEPEEERDEPDEPDEPAEELPDSETIEVSRLLVDGVPLQVTTRIDLHVTGKARELVLPDPMLDGAKLLQITAPVPVTLGEGGSVVLQVRRGTFAVELQAALPRSPTRLAPPEHPAPWPDDEVWVWNAAPAGAASMGQVSLTGARAVEHARTHAPSEWHGGATYRLTPTDGLELEVIQRGVSETSTNQLVLRREMMVDLAGTGWTVVDDVRGQMSTGNRLDLDGEQGVLGSVAINGQPQVVTMTDDGRSGVEVRGAELDMRAHWRVEGATSSLPLGGWSEAFDEVTLGFTLPRGWDLLHAEGPGSLGPTWLGAWRPLDLILLLGVVVLVGRIAGLGAGLAALVALGLAYTRNGDGYVMLLALIAGLTVLVPALRRGGLSRGVRAGLRIGWALAAFVAAFWVVWQVPAGVAAVWRDGLSGLAHVRTQTELVTVVKIAMGLAVVAGGVLAMAVVSARASKGTGRMAAWGLTALLAVAAALTMLASADDRGMLTPGTEETASMDFSEVGARQQMLAAAPEPAAVEEEMDEAGGFGQRHKGSEGQMGKPTSKRKAGLYAMKGPAEAVPAMSPNDDEDVWGGLSGSEVGEAYGVDGLGLVGTGRGGGGTGEGTIGLGNTGLIGKGGGGGTGSGYGRGSGASFGGRGRRVPVVRQAKAEVTGGLDRDVVRRIVRAHINEVRHCYNQGLTTDPTLEGRISVQFSIDAEGMVGSAVVSESTLPDASVGQCITKAVGRWKFPKPEGGGSVVVTHPFVLSSGGGAPGAEPPPPPPQERFVAEDVELPEVEPPAVPQTGEGTPEWNGPRWQMTLDRRVESDESVTLWLVTPTASRVISIVRAMALLLLVFLLLRQGWRARPGPTTQASSASRSAAAVVALVLLSMARPAAAAPPPELLEELGERVNAERPLAPSPDCDADCALVTELEVAVEGDELALRAEVHMAGPGVWALPGSVDTWLPRTVRIDGKPARAMAVYEGALLLHLPEGRHEVELSGPIGADSLDLDLAGSPKHVVVNAEGWTIDGVDEDDLADSLHLQRDRGGEPPAIEDPSDPEGNADGAEPERHSQDMEPWFAVQRHLQVGPRWTVETTVTRLSHGPSPTKVHVPLLPGEKVLEGSGKIDDPKATVTLRAPGESITWTSVLEPRASLDLVAPSDQDWTESWIISCAGAWQCHDEGVPATTDGGGTRAFHPWPGETLSVSFVEPRPADGQLLAIDRADLELELGETGTEARLVLKVRTATVAERTITLPADAHVGSVRMDGNDVPMAKDATELRLTFQPGLHEVEVELRMDEGATAMVNAPVIQLGGRAVNARVTFQYFDRSERVVVWTTGEGMGPMVWLWPYLGVLALLSLALARFTRSPLSAPQWFVLSLGFSFAALPVVWAWFLLVDLRKRRAERLLDPVRYNLAQIGLGLLTVVVLGIVLLTAKELLTSPVSTIVHGWSDGSALTWYEDRVEASTPAATVITAPLSLWRAVWAAWVVWVAWKSLAWSKWFLGAVSASGDGMTGWLRSRPEPEPEADAEETSPEDGAPNDATNAADSAGTAPEEPTPDTADATESPEAAPRGASDPPSDPADSSTP